MNFVQLELVFLIRGIGESSQQWFILMAMFSATLAGHPNQADVVDETAQKA
jgi:hypothetical protein